MAMMASSLYGKDQLLHHEGNGMNGNHTKGATIGDVWYGHGVGTGVPQRPRRLSFNGSDMELSDLKATGNSPDSPNGKIDPVHAVGLLALATTLAVSIKYLIPSFDAAFFKASVHRGTTMTTEIWYDFLERLARVRDSELWNVKPTFTHSQSMGQAIFAVAFGMLVSSFTWYVIYLDSSIPGVNPPTPFSASKKRYRGGSRAMERRFHLGYITAMVSGVVAFLVVLFG